MFRVRGHARIGYLYFTRAGADACGARCWGGILIALMLCETFEPAWKNQARSGATNVTAYYSCFLWRLLHGAVPQSFSAMEGDTRVFRVRPLCMWAVLLRMHDGAAVSCFCW
jgi:hypothetical protein